METDEFERNDGEGCQEPREHNVSFEEATYAFDDSDGIEDVEDVEENEELR